METGGNQDQGGRMPEDPWPVIGHQIPVLVCDWLPRPHCSIPGRWGLQRGGWSQLWSDNGNINIAEREALQMADISGASYSNIRRLRMWVQELREGKALLNCHKYRHRLRCRYTEAGCWRLGPSLG